jgi:hypothetical protein
MTALFPCYVVTITALHDEPPFLQLSPYELALRWKSDSRCKSFYTSEPGARLVWENDGVQRLHVTDAIVKS